MEEKKVYIIGAGVAGLVAAIELEKKGLSPVILEKSDRVGGRVKTDNVDGFLLDHGFQVLLTEYPEAKHFLNYEQLELRYFDPGAMIFEGEKSFELADPLRQPEKTLTMAFSPVGRIADKIKMWRLSSKLKAKGDAQIFNENATSTYDYLKTKGFSDKIIERFFRPFFAGIFLESELSTSSRMFEFVFKMFSLGNAAVPARGMQEIPNQLASKLQKTKIQFDVEIEKVEGKKIYIQGGETIDADQIIIASDPTRLIEGLKHQKQTYHDVVNIYFKADHTVIDKPLIALAAGKDRLINNFSYPTDVSESYAPVGEKLLSVSIVNTNGLEGDDLLVKVQDELEKLGIKGNSVRHLKTYHIHHALPKLVDLQYSVDPGSLRIYEDVIVAGDQALNPSLNAAMTSGRLAAEAVRINS